MTKLRGTASTYCSLKFGKVLQRGRAYYYGVGFYDQY